jgi:SecD/SecF fusion protein
MKDENRLLKWALVVVPVVAAGLALYPPSQKLKAGIDLAGGSSLLFEIDTSGLKKSEKVGLADRVMEVLKRRIDPNGQMNLIWRPIGNNRLEIQMPRPSARALERRKAYDEKRAELTALNLSRIEVEAMLNAPADQRAAKRDALIRGLEERGPLLDALIEAYDAKIAAAAGDDIDAEQSTRKAYEDALAAVLDTSLDLGRLKDVLALPNNTERQREVREKELDVLRAAHPSEEYSKALTATVEAYDEWSKDKGVLEDPSDLKRRIRGAGVLEFRILAERDPSTGTMTTVIPEEISKYVEQLHKRGSRPRPGDRYQWFEISDVLSFTSKKTIEDVEAAQPTMTTIIEKYAGKWYLLAHAESKYGLLKDSKRKWKLVGAFQGVDGRTGGPAVNFQLDPRGGVQFAKLTSENLKRPLAIFLDGKAQSWATIQSQIREHGQISGSNYTADDVFDLVATLRAGSLPARLIDTPIMEQTIGPQLGETNRKLGMTAAIIGGIAVALFILIYYRFAGVVADVALVLNLLFVLGIMAATQATFTLPGIAGLILTVGMAVDANVLIFERIREELDRGAGLKKALRLGYDRALSTIVDANVTTLITCVILGYLGTEEVKGFAMVLGFGIATSMFTSLFVTRLIFTSLIERGIIKNLSMMRILRKPNIDWLGLRRIFWPVSLVLVVCMLAVTGFTGMTNREALFDIEFLGGTSVQMEFKKGETLTDEDVRERITARSGDVESATQWLGEAADALEAATVSTGSTSTQFVITSTTLSGEEIDALVRGVLEPIAERNGFERGRNELTVDTKVEAKRDVAKLTADLKLAADNARHAAARLATARIQTVRSLDATDETPMAFEVITVETNKNLVKAAILAVMGDKLNVERAINFDVVTDNRAAPQGYWPIEEDDQYLSDVIPESGASYDIRKFKGGAVIVFDNLSPPISLEDFDRRIREIRLMPEFSQYEARPFQAIGLSSAGNDHGADVFSKLAYVVVDENIPYYDDPANWEEYLAKVELTQVSEALGTEKALRKVIQFAPQVAAQTQNQAILAVVMALCAIVAYIWIRFGQMQWGFAAVICLVHDVSITLGAVTLAHYLFATPLGPMLGLMDFKIDLAMIAAFLTIIGYSLNDTIVVFDRIRENRGKLKSVTAAMINNSINQTLSRTLLTSLTTFMAIVIMYIFGGPAIRGFAFAITIGLITGTYSSIGIAAPLLLRPRVLRVLVYILLALGIMGVFSMAVGGLDSGRTVILIAGVVVLAGLVWAIVKETGRSSGPVAGGAGA